MIKASPTRQLIQDTDPHVWFAGVLQELFGEVVRQLTAEPGPRSVEGIHDTRVAIRRFRSLIRDLTTILDIGPFKPLVKRLKKVADQMGTVRDQDVFIEGLKKMTADAEVPAAIQGRIDRAREKRDKAFSKLAKTLEKISPDDLSQLFDSAVERVLGEPDLFRPTSVTVAGHDMICQRLADLVKFNDEIYDPSDSKGLHKMRIAAKRLRYTADIYTPVFGTQLQEFVDETAQLQSFLGGMHDNDLWIGDLSHQLQKHQQETATSRSEKNELARMLAKLVRKRAKKYAAALKLWTKWQNTGRFKELGEVIGLEGEFNKKTS